MADLENVITHLQIIKTWASFARERDLQFFTAKHLEDIVQWSDDALNLLKEQEAELQKGRYYSDVFDLGYEAGKESIVRCEDCKHRETIYCPFYRKYKGTKYDNWYCADGEREDNG